MRLTTRFRPGFAALVSFTLSFQPSIQAAAESTLWADRRGFRSADRQPLFPPLPPIVSDLKSNALSPHLLKTLPADFLKRFGPALQAVSYREGTLRRASFPCSGPAEKLVIHLRDVHRHAEAQGHISDAILSLAQVPDLSVIGVEGAFSPLEDLRRFRLFGRRGVVKKTADYLLKQGIVTGAVHAGMTGPAGMPPLIGIDDEALHTANVEAYRDSLPVKKRLSEELSKWRRDWTRRRDLLLTEEYRRLDDAARDHAEGRLDLGAYLRILSSVKGVDAPPAVDAFLRALKVESSIDFKKAEADRSRLITRLGERLAPSRLDDLARKAVGYRSGDIRLADFHRDLFSAAREAGVPEKELPAFSTYGRYLSLVDAVDAESLLASMESLEASVRRRLARTPLERSLVAEGRRLALTEKLAAFSLASGEWGEYKSLSSAAAPPGLPLEPFEDFYSSALSRDRAMAERLSAEMSSRPGRVAILVAGGFHGEGMTALLTQKGIAVLSFTPRVTEVPSHGASYLDVFAQEKSPLEKLFSGIPLFVSQRLWDPVTRENALAAFSGHLYLESPGEDVLSAVRPLFPETAEPLKSIRVSRDKEDVVVTLATESGRTLQWRAPASKDRLEGVPATTPVAPATLLSGPAATASDHLLRLIELLTPFHPRGPPLFGALSQGTDVEIARLFFEDSSGFIPFHDAVAAAVEHFVSAVPRKTFRRYLSITKERKDLSKKVLHEISRQFPRILATANAIFLGTPGNVEGLSRWPALDDRARAFLRGTIGLKKKDALQSDDVFWKEGMVGFQVQMEETANAVLKEGFPELAAQLPRGITLWTYTDDRFDKRADRFIRAATVKERGAARIIIHRDAFLRFMHMDALQKKGKMEWPAVRIFLDRELRMLAARVDGRPLDEARAELMKELDHRKLQELAEMDVRLKNAPHHGLHLVHDIPLLGDGTSFSERSVGPIQGGYSLFTHVNEIPKGSYIKMEENPDSGSIVIDRTLSGDSPYEGNYGFFPQTYSDPDLDRGDGDPLDSWMLDLFDDGPLLSPGQSLRVRVIGFTRMIDGGIDNKVYVVPADDPRYDDIRDVKDLQGRPAWWAKVEQSRTFFRTYKSKEGKTVEIDDRIGSAAEARAEIIKAARAYQRKRSVEAFLAEARQRLKSVHLPESSPLSSLLAEVSDRLSDPDPMKRELVRDVFRAVHGLLSGKEAHGMSQHSYENDVVIPLAYVLDSLRSAAQALGIEGDLPALKQKERRFPRRLPVVAALLFGWLGLRDPAVAAGVETSAALTSADPAAPLRSLLAGAPLNLRVSETVEGRLRAVSSVLLSPDARDAWIRALSSRPERGNLSASSVYSSLHRYVHSGRTGENAGSAVLVVGLESEADAASLPGILEKHAATVAFDQDHARRPLELVLVPKSPLAAQAVAKIKARPFVTALSRDALIDVGRFSFGRLNQAFLSWAQGRPDLRVHVAGLAAPADEASGLADSPLKAALLALLEGMPVEPSRVQDMLEAALFIAQFA